jgi:hypothetical protein
MVVFSITLVLGGAVLSSRAFAAAAVMEKVVYVAGHFAGLFSVGRAVGDGHGGTVAALVVWVAHFTRRRGDAWHRWGLLWAMVDISKVEPGRSQTFVGR